MDGGRVSTTWLTLLVNRLISQQTALDRLDRYYTGKQPLAFMSPEVQLQVGNRVTPVAINWPRVIVGSIEERLDVEGFRLAQDSPVDDTLWDIWQANDLDEWSQLAHIDALVYGRAFVSVWAGDVPEIPRIAVESARQMAVAYKPGTRQVVAALKLWREDANGVEVDSTDWPNGVTQMDRAVLMLPDTIGHYWHTAAPGSGWMPGDWTLTETQDNPLGEVPVVPLVNRPRLTDLTGESELSDVLPLADAINKLATDMMVSSEFHAEPRRYATGLQVPRDAAQKTRLQVEVQKEWDEATKGKTWIAGPGVTFGQFQEAGLSNFIGAIQMLTGQVAAIAGLPPHYLGVNADNPASADAIRSAESSLVKKAQRKMRAFGGSWERVMRLALRVRDDNLPDGVAGMETVWRDPSTPTPAQKADAAVKLTQGDRPIITVAQAREDLGYSPPQIARMADDEAVAVASAATADVEAKVALANKMMAEQGISQTAAFAAVGLLAAATAMGSAPVA